MFAAFAHADNQIAREPTKLRVCVLPYGEIDPTLGRFSNLYTPTRVIKSSRDLAECQLVVMPSDWYRDAAAFDDGLRFPVEEWVVRGGALLVFQPNPPDEATIQLASSWFRVNNWYDRDDGAVKLAKHPVLANLDDIDLPFPADRIISHDKRWTALVAGTKSQGVSLLVRTLGDGRVAVDTDNPLRQVTTGTNHTDAFMRSLVSWLVKKP